MKKAKTFLNKKLIAVISGILIILYVFKPIQIIMLNFYNPKMTSMMKYRIKEEKKKGKVLKIRQKWVPLSKISSNLVKAVIISEDSKFWEHNGFDIEGIKYAIKVNLKKRRFVRGGSTISQQVAKNLFLNPKKSIFRKLYEAVLTVEIETFLSKKRILEIYLNIVEWGEGIFGAEVAALHYFNKHASSLTAEEALRLAAILPNPRRYSPLKSSYFLERRLQKLRREFYRNVE
jgi:monofunctional biosynthetic peptidoglycan transglycosylase